MGKKNKERKKTVRLQFEPEGGGGGEDSSREQYKRNNKNSPARDRQRQQQHTISEWVRRLLFVYKIQALVVRGIRGVGVP